MPQPKANLNTPPSKAKKPGSASKSVSPLKASRSIDVDVNQTFIVRPAPGDKHDSTTKIYQNIDTIRALGLNSGECVLLRRKGEPGILGFVHPPMEAIRDDTILISKSLRRVSGILLGDRVTVAKHPRPDFATKVVIGCKEDISGCRDEVQKVLEAINLVSAGIEFTINGHTGVIVDVQGMPAISKLSLEDGGSETSKLLAPALYFEAKKAIVEFTTSLQVNSDAPPRVGYSTIGGLQRVITSLKAAIELPLHHPNLFKRFHSSPERGFLLHGPPGTGKTTLLRAVAQETNAHVLTIDGPSIVSKYLGETEKALRRVFEEARDFQPAIVFIDEIDSIVPKRDSDDAGEAESRVVSTMLTMMDGGAINGQVCVIGATNRPNQIDPALRRPGRFGTEFEIGIPDVEGRLDILQLQLKDTPHKLTVEYIQSLAARTHGYVGSDLYALRRDAVMRAIQRGLAENTAEEDTFIEVDDLERALVDIRPSAMREVVLETPKVYWTDIGGQNSVKRALHEAIELPLSHPDTFTRLGIQPPRGILLYGPPGCSKTLVAKALATETGLNFLAVKGPEIFNKYVGESERAIREVFRKARAAAPSVIFFDEIDALSAARGHGEAGGDRVLTSLLNEMDGIEALNGVTVLAATNIPDTIDSALMRPGRLDRKIYVPPPDLSARTKILEIKFKKMSMNEEISLESLAERTEGCSGAEVVSLCQEAGMFAMSEDINIDKIQPRHFDQALAKLQKAITPEMIEYFEEFSKVS